MCRNFLGRKLRRAFKKQVRTAIVWAISYVEPSKTSARGNLLGRKLRGAFEKQVRTASNLGYKLRVAFEKQVHAAIFWAVSYVEPSKNECTRHSSGPLTTWSLRITSVRGNLIFWAVNYVYGPKDKIAAYTCYSKAPCS